MDTLNPPRVAFTTRLRQHTTESAQRRAAERAKQESEALKEWEERFTPVIDRLRTLIARIPPWERNKPRSLEFFRTALRGRQGRAAQAGAVGEALRQLGWIRQRGWSKADNGFRAVWIPPEQIR